MSTNLDEAREAVRKEFRPREVERIEALARAVAEDVYAERTKPRGGGSTVNLAHVKVGELSDDERARALLGDPRDSVSVGPEGAVYHRHESATSPTDTGAGEAAQKAIDDLIAEAESYQSLTGKETDARGALIKRLTMKLIQENINARLFLGERDAARTSLEAMERRVGELEGALEDIADSNYPVPVRICRHADRKAGGQAVLLALKTGKNKNGTAP